MTIWRSFPIPPKFYASMSGNNKNKRYLEVLTVGICGKRSAAQLSYSKELYHSWSKKVVLITEGYASKAKELKYL